ncbi:MAG: gamma carbonic anhydrase family protein [Bacteriovoracaceae bacterium]|jgi:carbonic anhydrase/acetyltransferase-like protein (isoleucine patch superfamily)|nr:gamma carbonic anhydrase family protein [Bacteriovoracaceae bacterium]
MEIYSYKQYTPKYNESNYIAAGVKIIGRANLGSHVNIWHNTVIRADVNKIEIEENSNIQDLSMLHVTHMSPLLIGKNVTVGHSVTLHGCCIGNNSLIGMGATILDGAKVGNFCIVAAGSTVPPNKCYEDYSMIMGAPAKMVRKLTDSEIDMLNKHYKSYLEYAQSFNDTDIVKRLV